MGACIDGIGTRNIIINGVKKLNGCEFKIMADRISTATYIIAAGITKGDIFIKDAKIDCINAEVNKLLECGLSINVMRGGIRVKCNKQIKAVNIETSAFPGFHTDIQPLFSTLMVIADGTSVIKETILENRFDHLTELEKMGASIKIKLGNFFCPNGKRGKVAIIKGKSSLKGGEVKANDLRAAAALLIAGLAAEGCTTIYNVEQLYRGYESIDEDLINMGAHIIRNQ